jgi:uncharacterized protein (DUF885 family)
MRRLEVERQPLPDTRAQASDRLAALAERIWQYRVSSEPYLQMRCGIAVRTIRPDTLATVEEDAAFAAGALAELRRVGAAVEGHEDVLTVEFLREELNRTLAAPRTWSSRFGVTPYACSWLGIYVRMIFQTFSFDSTEGTDRYLALMLDYTHLIDSMRDKAALQAQRGWRVPKPALPGAVETLRGLKVAAARTFPVSSDRLAKLTDTQRKQFDDEVDRIWRTQAEPAFDSLIATLGPEYEREAPQGVGLSQFPGGEEAYRALVREHATFDIDPERIHVVGVAEVARLCEEMRAIRSSLGFDGSEASFNEHLRTSGRLHARSPRDVEDRYRYHMERMSAVVSRYFGKLPLAKYDVAPLDESMQGTISYGYYEPPTKAQPLGIYKYNGSGLDTRSQLNSAALIYHELVPGHHFHLALQAENEALPRIRREALGITAFNEGWAEYASGLALEMGLYDDPYDHYGRLAHERFIAQRLVVDTGLNLLGWSLEQAREYMKMYTLESGTQIASETLRYSTDLPGQALAYGLGCLKFRQLRERAERALGSRFDARSFHDALLAAGALPMTILDRHIDEFIASHGTGTNARAAL